MKGYLEWGRVKGEINMVVFEVEVVVAVVAVVVVVDMEGRLEWRSG